MKLTKDGCTAEFSKSVAENLLKQGWKEVGKEMPKPKKPVEIKQNGAK